MLLHLNLKYTLGNLPSHTVNQSPFFCELHKYRILLHRRAPHHACGAMGVSEHRVVELGKTPSGTFKAFLRRTTLTKQGQLDFPTGTI